MSRPTLIVRLLLLPALALLLAAGCARQVPPAPASKPPPPRPMRAIRISVPGGTIRVPDPTGARVWEASADLLVWDGDRETARLTGVVCNFIEMGQVVLSARAPAATAYVKEHRVVLEQGVQASSNPRKSSFTAQRVEWNTTQRKVYATGNVKFTSNQFVTTGPGLEADLDLKRVRMKQVKAMAVR